MRILLVNDDGIAAPGFRVLATALQAAGHQVTCVAPDGNRSAVSHGLTIRTPLFAREHDIAPGIPAWAVSGTPADCTRLALCSLCPQRPELVVSGPNVGYNTGHDVFYSGTVGAALEGAMQGVRSIALSAGTKADAGVVAGIFLSILSQLDLERDVRSMLNINVPGLPLEEIRGVLWAPQSTDFHWYDDYQRRVSPDGVPYYWIAGTEKEVPDTPEDDLSAVVNGYVAVTPMTFDLTDRAAPWGKELSL